MANVFMPGSQEEEALPAQPQIDTSRPEQQPGNEGGAEQETAEAVRVEVEGQPQEVLDDDGGGGEEVVAEEEGEGGLSPDIEEAVARFKENPEQFDDLINKCIG